jgi:FkbM family methyltransferase
VGIFQRNVRRLIERLATVDLERTNGKSFNGKSFFVIYREEREDAWYSYRATLRSVLNRYAVDHVIDVGANTGQFGRHARSIYSGRISSFEPVSRAFAQLAGATAADENWHAYPYALGAQSGTKTIHVSLSSVYSSLLKSNDFCATRFGNRSVGEQEESVTMRRLDEVLEEISPGNNREKIYLKLDTQGYDIEVFKGLGDKLQNVVALQSEVSLIPIYENMPHWTESISTYEKAGFGVAGMFPLGWDAGRVIEYDCVMTRIAGSY